MFKRFFILFFCILGVLILKAQDSASIIHIYWGQVPEVSVTADQIKVFSYVKVHDTLKSRNISEVTKFRFMIQPVMQGDVKVADAKGAYFTDRMKNLVANPASGDRIIISEVYAKVENEGERKIPAAIVFVVQ